MAQTLITDQQTQKARQLLQQGYVAYNNWEINKARLLWRKAAITDPANEAIWTALLNVTQTDEDRRVCLQNILVLNPNNADAEARLRLLENDTQPSDVQASFESELQILRPEVRDNLWLMLGWGLTAIIVALVGFCYLRC